MKLKVIFSVLFICFHSVTNATQEKARITVEFVEVREMPGRSVVYTLTKGSNVVPFLFTREWIKIMHLPEPDDIIFGWVKAGSVRMLTNPDLKTAPLSSETCTVELETGTPVCITPQKPKFKCHIAALGGFHNDCEINLAYVSVADVKNGNMIEVVTKCNVEFKYKSEHQYNLTKTTKTLENTIILNSYTFNSSAIKSSFKLGYSSNLSEAKVSDVNCRLSANLIDLEI